MWEESIAAINKYNADEVRGELWYGYADMNTGKRTATTYGALDAFSRGFSFKRRLERAKRLQDQALKCGINTASNRSDYAQEEAFCGLSAATGKSNQLTSSIITRKTKNIADGQKLFEDFVEYCKSEVGYAGLKMS